ncbi:hypothetical protein [Arenimonas sp.]|uniref:hypothetical protein n=1 Tax=Arenimonas sp. TaxID=1872635 RepID=UPI002E3103AF|nr:hypothetical protein [Arenimonas sp.]HEX4853867.1 hypothetical protein [Arenimonas sp.]
MSRPERHPDPIHDAARDLFDRASERLDQGAAFRLRRARHEAQQPRRRRLPALVPAGAFAAAVLALGVAWWLPSSGTLAPEEPDLSVAAVPAAEFDILLAEEDPELYIWLADAPVATAAGPRP